MGQGYGHGLGADHSEVTSQRCHPIGQNPLVGPDVVVGRNHGQQAGNHTPVSGDLGGKELTVRSVDKQTIGDEPVEGGACRPRREMETAASSVQSTVERTDTAADVARWASKGMITPCRRRP